MLSPEYVTDNKNIVHCVAFITNASSHSLSCMIDEILFNN